MHQDKQYGPSAFSTFMSDIGSIPQHWPTTAIRSIAFLGTRAGVEALHRRCVNSVAAMKPWLAATCPVVLLCIVLQLLSFLMVETLLHFDEDVFVPLTMKVWLFSDGDVG